MKLLAPPIYTAEQLVDKEKETNLSANTSQNFVLVFMRFLVSTCSTFIICNLFKCHREFDKIFKCIISVLKFAMKQNCKRLSSCG